MTEPLVPADLDLRAMQFMPLDVVRLRDSEIASVPSGEAFRAAVLLWCVAWHQVPASSLPNTDAALANYAGFGRDIKAWLKVKDEALRNFILCTDGRLYHTVIAEKALETAAKRQSYRDRTKRATETRRQRNVQRNDDVEPERDVVVPPEPPATKVSKGKLSEDKKEDKTADAVVSSDKKYSFDGVVIKLAKKHFDEWERVFAHLDLRGELVARDAWLASDRATDDDRKNWFISTSKYLANRNMEARGKVQKAKEFRTMSGMEGVI